MPLSTGSGQLSPSRADTEVPSLSLPEPCSPGLLPAATQCATLHHVGRSKVNQLCSGLSFVGSPSGDISGIEAEFLGIVPKSRNSETGFPVPESVVGSCLSHVMDERHDGLPDRVSHGCSSSDAHNDNETDYQPHLPSCPLCSCLQHWSLASQY